MCLDKFLYLHIIGIQNALGNDEAVAQPLRLMSNGDYAVHSSRHLTACPYTQVRHSRQGLPESRPQGRLRLAILGTGYQLPGGYDGTYV